jgi:hypothetical protein
MEVIMKLRAMLKIMLLTLLATSSTIFAGKRLAEDAADQEDRPAKAARLTQEETSEPQGEIQEDTITLISSDGDSRAIPRHRALLSGTIKNMLDVPGDTQETNQNMPLPEVSSATMHNLVACLEIIGTNTIETSLSADGYTKLSDFIKALSANAYADLINAVNFLDIQVLQQSLIDNSVDFIISHPEASHVFSEKLPLEMQELITPKVHSTYNRLFMALYRSRGFTFEPPHTKPNDFITHTENLSALINYYHNLEEVNFTSINTTDRDLTLLARYLGNLTHLDLSDFHNITDADLTALVSYFPKLTSLELHYLPKVTDAGLRGALQNLQKLTHLALENMPNITDDGLIALQNLPSLSSLELFYLPNATDTGLREALQNLHNLTSLTLISLNLTDTGFRALQNPESLTQLTLINLNITDASLIALTPYLYNLKNLTLQLLPITDANLIAFTSRLPNLTHLTLGYLRNLTEATKQRLLAETYNYAKNQRSLTTLCLERLKNF